jgi:hypothetical protein
MYLEQFKPFRIVHIAGSAPNQEVADSLSRLHLHNLALPKTDNLSDEEARMAQAGEGGDDAAMMQHITAGEFFCHFERAASVNLKRSASSEEKSIRLVPQEREECESVKAYLDADDRSLHEMLVRAVEEPEVELKSNSADSECQTNADDFEQAKRVLKGLYPHRRFIEKVHNETHPSIATTWARVQRACNFPPGKKYQDAKDEVVRFCKSCIVCQKLKPARERLEQRAGSIKRAGCEWKQIYSYRHRFFHSSCRVVSSERSVFCGSYVCPQ